MGGVERNHRVLNEYFRIYFNANMSNRNTYLRYFTFAYEKYSPFELVFSKKPNMLKDILHRKIDSVYNMDYFVKEAKYRFQLAHKSAIELIDKIKSRNKKIYDQKINSLN